MPEMKRHIGKIKNTDKRCVVVYMQIPGREDHALIVDTDALPERHHEELMSIVEHEGQKNTTLADVLGRRMSTHSGMDILNTLHTSGYLQPVKTDLVEMHPMPGRKIDLNKVIEMTGSQKSQWDPSKTENPHNAPGSDQRQPSASELMEALEPDGSTDSRVSQEAAPPAYDPSQDPGVTSTQTVGDDPNASGYNRILENQQVDKQEQMHGVAQNMIVEAEMLEQEAQQKRNRAYELAPSLKPKPAQSKAQNSSNKSSSNTSKSNNNTNAQSTGKKSAGRPKKSENQSSTG